MPWKEVTVMQEKETFISAAIQKEISFSQLCSEYGISRKTGYKWLARYRSGEGLQDRSRAPVNSSTRTTSEIEQLILQEREKHPTWGPRKLERTLKNQGYTDLPCKSTIGNILKRNDCIEPEASEAAKAYQHFERERPNELWQMDYKGDFGLLNGQRCFPLTILDDHSRFNLCLHACSGTNSTEFTPIFTRILEEYGLPDAILCDNGKPWGDCHNGGITAFDVWMMQMDVLPIHGKPLHPQTQGKDERFHRTLKNDLLKRQVFLNLQSAQAAFDPWREEYNNERPHEALQLEVPAKYYRPSKKAFPKMNQQVVYDSGKRLRRVNCKGYISISRKRYFLSDSLIGEYIQINDCDNDVVALQYGQFEIARINLAEGLFVSKRRLRVKQTESASIKE